MLQTIHDNIKGWVAYVLLGAIALVFVLWGINWTFGAPTYAAKINGHEISAEEIRQVYQQQLAQAERSAQGQLDETQRNDIKARVLDDYVSTEALLDRVQTLGYRVSDDELLNAMSQIPAFQVDGKFDRVHAVAVLKAQGRSVAEVEALIRRQVQLTQLENALRASSFATDGEVKQIQALIHQQRELGWIVVPAAGFASQANPPEAEVKAYYDSHKSQYLTPETVTLRYVELNIADLSGKVSLSDAQLKAFYDEQKAKTPEIYTQAEQRRASHILFAVNDPKDDAAVKAKAQAVYARAKGGEDFGKLAKEFSQDTASAQQGGDLGWADHKVWVAPFADAAFGMQIHEIRGPIKSQFGYHIIKLDDIRPAADKTFEQSKADLAALYRQNEAERLFNNAQDQLADAALQNATDIDVVARKAGLAVKEIRGFSRESGGGALGASPKVLEAAFSADGLDGRLSPIVEVDKGRGVVLKATDHQPPQQKPLDSVRAEVLAALKKQAGSALAAAAAKDAAKRLGQGEAWAGIGKSLGVAVQVPHFVSRADPSVPAQIGTAAFAVPKPTGMPIYQDIVLDNGDAAVFGVLSVRLDPKPDPQSAGLRQQYADRLAGIEAGTYATGARAEASVTLNPQAID